MIIVIYRPMIFIPPIQLIFSIIVIIIINIEIIIFLIQNWELFAIPHVWCVCLVLEISAIIIIIIAKSLIYIIWTYNNCVCVCYKQLNLSLVYHHQYEWTNQRSAEAKNNHLVFWTNCHRILFLLVSICCHYVFFFIIKNITLFCVIIMLMILKTT